MTDELPRATTREHAWSAAICRRLDAQNELLQRILDRLPDPPTQEAGTGVVELREPLAPAGTPGPEPAKQAPARTARPRATRARTKKEAT